MLGLPDAWGSMRRDELGSLRVVTLTAKRIETAFERLDIALRNLSAVASEGMSVALSRSEASFAEENQQLSATLVEERALRQREAQARKDVVGELDVAILEIRRILGH